jgi:hypothetical protein
VCSLAMSCPTIRNPRMYWQPMSLDTEALLASVSAAHLYTMPGTKSVHAALDLDEGLKPQFARARPSGGCQPLITNTKIFDVTRESESSTRSS